MPTTPIGTWLAERWRRFSLVRFLTRAFAIVLAAQAVTSMILLAIARQRKRRRPAEGFPHLEQTEFHVGENALRLYSYGMGLYDAMLEAIEGRRRRSTSRPTSSRATPSARVQAAPHRKAREGVAVYVIFDTFGNLSCGPRSSASPRGPRHVVRRDPPSVAPARSAPLRGGPPQDAWSWTARSASSVGSTSAPSTPRNGATPNCASRGPRRRRFGQSFAEFWNRRSPRSNSHAAATIARRFDPLHLPAWHRRAAPDLPHPRHVHQAIDRAERNILLTNAYFVPDHILSARLKGVAARRGRPGPATLDSQTSVITDWVARGYFTGSAGRYPRLRLSRR